MIYSQFFIWWAHIGIPIYLYLLGKHLSINLPLSVNLSLPFIMIIMSLISYILCKHQWYLLHLSTIYTQHLSIICFICQTALKKGLNGKGLTHFWFIVKVVLGRYFLIAEPITFSSCYFSWIDWIMGYWNVNKRMTTWTLLVHTCSYYF